MVRPTMLIFNFSIILQLLNILLICVTCEMNLIIVLCFLGLFITTELGSNVILTCANIRMPVYQILYLMMRAD